MQIKTESQKLKLEKSILYGVTFLLFGIPSYSQCAMCRASLESSGETSQAEALNDGIVYLMIIPYILVGLAGWYIFKMYKKKKKY